MLPALLAPATARVSAESGGGSRDLRIDFFRGLALWWIFIDHVSGNRLQRLTLSQFTLCDAAEVFVLLAGMSAAIAYGRRLERGGYLAAAQAVLRRVGTLYVVHLFMFVVVTAEVASLARLFDRPDILARADLDVLAHAPFEGVTQAVLLRFQPNFMDILPTYVALLLLFALALPLLRRPLALLGGSLALYVAARWLGWRPAFWMNGWTLNPLAWQALFMLGAASQAAPRLLPRPRRALDAAAALLLAAGFVVLHWHAIAAWLAPGAGAADWQDWNDKTGLHPLRLASIVALAWLARSRVPAEAGWLRSRLATPLALCGQHSLPVFCAGIALALLGESVLGWNAGWLAQLAVNVIGAAAMWSVARAAAWSRDGSRAPAPA